MLNDPLSSGFAFEWKIQRKMRQCASISLTLRRKSLCSPKECEFPFSLKSEIKDSELDGSEVPLSSSISPRKYHVLSRLLSDLLACPLSLALALLSNKQSPLLVPLTSIFSRLERLQATTNQLILKTRLNCIEKSSHLRASPFHLLLGRRTT